MIGLISTSRMGRAETDEPLLLEVYVNGRSTGKIGEFVQRDKELLLRRSELKALGFRQPDPFALRDPNSASYDELVALTAIQGLTSRMDSATQSLYITVPIDRLQATSLLVEEETPPNGRVRIESGIGTTMNYDVTSTFTGGQRTVSGLLDSRAFSPRGVLSSGLLAGASTNVGGPLTTTLARLDTTYTFGDVNTLRRYSLGDFITTGLSWTRPVRFEGVQIRSDFSMRPDLVTFPLPTVSGAVAVPSAVDILANGNLVISRQVDAGPFEVPQLPVASGAGTISMTVTNALGQQVRIAQPFYASAALLRPGLQNFSVQAGLVRLNWGVVSNDYGKFAMSTTYRRGMTRKFTLEADAEGTAGTVMAGGGGLLQVGNLGILNFALSGSGGAAGAGGQLSVGAQRIGRAFSAGVSTTIATADFQDVAARNGDPVPRRQQSANISFSTKRLGSLGLFYGGLDRVSAVDPVTSSLTPAQQTRTLTASYSHPVRHMSFFINAFEDFSSGNGPGVQVGLTIPLGSRQSAEVSVGSDGTSQVQVQRSATAIGEWGYQAYVAGGDGTHEFAQEQYKSRWGLLTGGVDSDLGTTSVRLETQGAISVADGGVFPSNTIYDSFAIVDTGATTRVHVLQENREVGTTGSSGRLLVPDLRSYDLNRLAIVPTDVGLDTTIQEARREVRPQDRSGIVVRFEVKISHAALLQLVDEHGQPLPVGSVARLRGTRQTEPVGYDGDAYIEDLKPRNEVEVVLPDGSSCVAKFNYKPLPGEIPKIGPLRCAEPQPETRPNLQTGMELDLEPSPKVSR